AVGLGVILLRRVRAASCERVRRAAGTNRILGGEGAVSTMYEADGKHAGNDAAPAEAKLAALDVLTDVLEGRFGGARWARVPEIVQSMDIALSAGDPGALEAATADLELAGPTRITRVGAIPQVPAPSQVRERVNRMVHSLTGEAAATDRGQADRG